MSTAYMRGDMLTLIADSGGNGIDELREQIPKFLGDAPGPWMPEEFLASYELVERSINNATEAGRERIFSILRRLVRCFFVKIKHQPLDYCEARQFLSAIILLLKYPSPENACCIEVLEFAKQEHEKFWTMVSAPKDIVRGRRKDFVNLLLTQC